MKHGVDHVYDEKYDSNYRHIRFLPVHGLEGKNFVICKKNSKSKSLKN